MTHQELVEKAFEAMKNAYAPYSNYHVGAALLTKDGTVYKGANIENASYGATNCGERTAVFAAYANGVRQKDIEALAIVSDGEKLAAPCGNCSQVLSELLLPDTTIILCNHREYKETNIQELLPMMFGPEDL